MHTHLMSEWMILRTEVGACESRGIRATMGLKEVERRKRGQGVLGKHVQGRMSMWRSSDWGRAVGQGPLGRAVFRAGFGHPQACRTLLAWWGRAG